MNQDKFVKKISWFCRWQLCSIP